MDLVIEAIESLQFLPTIANGIYSLRLGKEISNSCPN